MGANDTAPLLTRHRLTVAGYHRMGEAGIVAHDARVELINGELIDMAAIGTKHASAVARLTRAAFSGVGNAAERVGRIGASAVVSLERVPQRQHHDSRRRLDLEQGDLALGTELDDELAPQRAFAGLAEAVRRSRQSPVTRQLDFIDGPVGKIQVFDAACTVKQKTVQSYEVGSRFSPEADLETHRAASCRRRASVKRRSSATTSSAEYDTPVRRHSAIAARPRA